MVMDDMDGALDDIAGAELFSNGDRTRFRDGRYRLRVQRLTLKRSFQTRTPVFIGEFLVEQATPIMEGVTPNEVGTQVSFAVNFGGPAAMMAGRNVKEFVLALLGVDSTKVTEAELKATIRELVSDAQPATGALIDNETFRKVSRKGKTLVLNGWRHVPVGD